MEPNVYSSPIEEKICSELAAGNSLVIVEDGFYKTKRIAQGEEAALIDRLGGPLVGRRSNPI